MKIISFIKWFFYVTRGFWLFLLSLSLLIFLHALFPRIVAIVCGSALFFGIIGVFLIVWWEDNGYKFKEYRKDAEQKRKLKR